VWQAIRIENLAITGENTWVSQQTAKLDTRYDDSSFLADGVTDDSRHAPYAGICIDPLCEPAMQWNNLLHIDVIGEVARPVRDSEGLG
jgi:hypothetical protein